MDKRTLLALFLIMVIYLISSQFVWNKNKPKPEANQPVQQVKQENAEKEIVKSPSKAESSEIDFSSQNDVAVNDKIILENDLVRFIFSNKGAVLTKVYLKEYFSKDTKSNVQLIPENGSIFGAEISANNLLKTDDKIFNYSHSGNVITFELNNGAQKIAKRFELTHDYNLRFDFSVDIDQPIQNYQLDFSAGINDTEEYVKYKGMDYKAVIFANNTLSSFKLDKIKRAQDRNERLFNEEIEKISWATLRSKFFMFGIIPDERVIINDAKIMNVNDSPAMIIKSEFNNDIYENISDGFNIYCGPIIQENLEDYGKEFIQSSELIVRWYRPFSKWFNVILNYINKLINNFGISIIIFALLIKLLLYPLTHKSFESSQKMKKIQPEMKRIQAKYKGDHKQLQIELNKLYKENGVNPLGGCLPLLLQMPILFSLYPVLRYSIHLRQVSFLWLNDLSAPDTIINLPFNIPLLGSNLGILPIVMAFFMFFQQKMMMPNTEQTDDMDEKQLATMQSQKMMMYLMPIMMFVFFNNFPSGLVLYWTIFNIFSMGQQYIIKRKFEQNVQN